MQLTTATILFLLLGEMWDSRSAFSKFCIDKRDILCIMCFIEHLFDKIFIFYKSKKDYYSEIDTFLNDDRVQKLSEDKKKQVKNSAYILKVYYSDLK